MRITSLYPAEKPETDQGEPRPTHRRQVWFKHSLLGLLILIIVLPLTGMAYQSIATRMDQRTFLPTGQLTNVGGYMLHIHCAGEGSPTIIMESGLGGTSLDW